MIGYSKSGSTKSTVPAATPSLMARKEQS